MPHPPVIVPAVGGPRAEDDCRATVDACRRAARRLVAARPDRLVLVSPHAPRLPEAFLLAGGARFRGGLGRFGAPGASVDLPIDDALIRRLVDGSSSAPGPGARIAVDSRGVDRSIDRSEDHGAIVPLWFLVEAGWAGPTTVASLPHRPTPAECRSFGRAVWQAIDRLPDDDRTAVVASGDMSHRVLPGAPAGHHPRAVDFDRAFVELVRRAALDRLEAIDPRLRELAAEDVVESTLCAAEAVLAERRARGTGSRPSTEVLSYEHPFGVGYLVAVLHDPDRS